MVVFYDGGVVFILVVRIGGWFVVFINIDIVYVFGDDLCGGGFFCFVNVGYNECLCNMVGCKCIV